MEEISEKDSLERVHRLLAISICLLAFLMFSSWFLSDMITKSLVIIFVPLLITISYSIIQQKAEEVKTKYTTYEPYFYKTVGTIVGLPDDIANALLEQRHRSKWDIRLLSALEHFSPSYNSPKLDKSVSFKDHIAEIILRYKSLVEGVYEEKLNYAFFKRSEESYIILEKVCHQGENNPYTS